MALKPILDFILVKRLDEAPKGSIVIPDSHKEKSNKAVVVAIGNSVVRGGVVFPLTDFVAVGDIVLISQYGAEDLNIDDEPMVLVRIQDIKGVDDGK